VGSSVGEAVAVAVVGQSPSVHSVLENEVDVLGRVAESVVSRSSGEAGVRVKPYKAAWRTDRLLIASDAHLFSQLTIAV
jgi:hypothetical protein